MERRGINNLDQQKANRSLVLHILADHDASTRVEISRETGLTQASITKIISEMIDTGLVSETGPVDGRHGHRSIGISLNGEKLAVMGVKIARKSFDVAVFDFRGKLRKTDPALGARHAVERIRRQMQELMGVHPNILAIGIAVPGPFLSREGRVALMSEFSGWEQIDINEEYSRCFDIPIYIEHDANAGAMAIWRREKRTGGVLVHLLASEGVGAGVMVNGAILRGSNGTAGEVGHMSINASGPRCSCGNRGCLEGYTSALAFAKTVQGAAAEHPESSLAGEREITAETVFRHARAGDALAIRSVREVGKWFGYGIANIVYLYDPDEIVITDIMTGGGDIMLDAIRETVKQRVLPEIYQGLTIRMETSRVDCILSGAADVAIERVLRDPDLVSRACRRWDRLQSAGE